MLVQWIIYFMHYFNLAMIIIEIVLLGMNVATLMPLLRIKISNAEWDEICNACSGFPWSSLGWVHNWFQFPERDYLTNIYMYESQIVLFFMLITSNQHSAGLESSYFLKFRFRPKKNKQTKKTRQTYYSKMPEEEFESSQEKISRI